MKSQAKKIRKIAQSRENKKSDRKKPFVAPTLTEEASLTSVTLVSGRGTHRDVSGHGSGHGSWNGSGHGSGRGH